MCSVIEGRTVCRREGAGLLFYFPDFTFFFFCLCCVFSVCSLFVPVNKTEPFLSSFYFIIFFDWCYVFRGSYFKTKEGIFKCASLKTDLKKATVRVLCRYAVEGESRVLRFACPLLSFTTPLFLLLAPRSPPTPPHNAFLRFLARAWFVNTHCCKYSVCIDICRKL